MCHSPAQEPRQLWTWIKNRKTAAVGTIPLDNEEEALQLQWKTLFKLSDKPGAMQDEAKQYPYGYGQADKPPPQPLRLTQEQMQQAFDQNALVGDEEPTTQRQKRERRSRVHHSSLRIFTQDPAEAEIRIDEGNKLIVVAACHSHSFQ